MQLGLCYPQSSRRCHADRRVLRSASGVALAIVLILPGCGRSYEASFRASYKKSFEKSCTIQARGLGPKVAEICACAAQEVLRRLNALELTELSLHIAPRSTQRKAIDAVHSCVARAYGNDRPYVAYPAKNRCVHDAWVTHAVQPDFPYSARFIKGPLTAEVVVTIAPSGALANAKVYASSGRHDIDEAAVRAAIRSTYAPKMVNCNPVESRYLFRADFQPG